MAGSDSFGPIPLTVPSSVPLASTSPWLFQALVRLVVPTLYLCHPVHQALGSLAGCPGIDPHRREGVGMPEVFLYFDG